ncbi:hypothetical protein ABLB37_15745 [Vibrio parahaemolyticus]|uniref:Uncharacterized protein n=2 Tax=Vibrio parahaemolyticus TaxID=670 RepID=Q87TJ5_VIBPA|nr:MULTISPECIES: hypothetical protein [Vibrio]EFO38211.1 conserved hypothetical protein [Vibrio parahaemolyticus Peru-466]EFO50152.1 conserved hypothetical protein [Vibrio parahaemolyticus K5030]EVU14717.1 hypothetical protein D046_4921 [Vibrio parahaemolyticus V-223/04]ARC18590.1 hypothetical protein A6J30_08415 [Vibrio parahaemolyticus]AYF16713.1 hypothetical protein FORC72_2982 [Vibrio parahaemolyticus]
MSKRLCKMNRKQIAANLGDIHRLVVAPKFVCRSCARSSASKDSLCKPAAIPPQKCQDKPLNEQQACGLLAEALPAQSISVTPKHSAEKAAIVKRVVERVKEKKQAAKVVTPVSMAAPALFDLADKKALKKAKKALKKHYKQQKKLLKVAKKQQKLLKRQRKLEARNAKLEVLLPTPPNALMGVSSQAKVH